MMYLEYFIVGILFILSIINLIMYKAKKNLSIIILGIIISLSYIAFLFIDIVKPYTEYYLIFVSAYTVIFSMFFVTKKITKNLTEYDYFELESSYKSLEDDREKLRERYLSTISLIEEGIIFYENGSKDVILSDRAHEIFGGSQSSSLEEHAKRIHDFDRQEYLKQIERASTKTPTYQIQYRIASKNDEYIWVLERGHYIGVDNKKSLIACVIPLDVKAHKPSTYFDIDSVLGEEKLFPKTKELINQGKPFSYISFELSNIPELNKKYSRDMGSLMMSEYLKMIKKEYTNNAFSLFRVTGIRFILLIEDDILREKFHNDLVNTYSELYKSTIKVSAVKENVEANFSLINLDDIRGINSTDLYNLSLELLDEAVLSKRKNFVIYNE